MSRKRVLVISDFHSGHVLGLTPPSYDYTTGHKTQTAHYQVRRKIWEWYKDKVKRLKPDIVIFNGDAIDGKGEKSGGTELLTLDRDEQCEMAIAALQAIPRRPKLFMSYGCLMPNSRILTADLRWVPVGRLVVGEKLIAFEEYPSAPRNRRKLLATKVTHNKPLTKRVYRLLFSDGTRIDASEDHPFLLNRGEKYKWYTVKQLYKWMYYEGTSIRNKRKPIAFGRFMPVWDDIGRGSNDYGDSYAAGYLAGFFDGEGTLNQSTKERRNNWPEHVFNLQGYQNDNPMLDATCKYLDKLGFKYAVQYRENKNKVVQILGGRWEKMRLLGSIRPPRLMSKFNPNILGTLKNPFDSDLLLENMVFIGEQRVCGLSTESGTYISEGFLSHNTGYHTGNLEDWEDIIAREIEAEKIGAEDTIDVNGLLINYRHHVGRSGIPHGRHTAVAKEKLWNAIWAERGEYPRADVIVRSHVHYYNYAGGPSWLGMTTPALQGYGSKFGARRVTGTVDVGMVHFDIFSKERWSWEAHILRFPAEAPLEA